MSQLISAPFSSPSEQLLLAQAVYQLGTSNWDVVNQLLQQSDRIPLTKRARLSSEACSNVFGEIANKDGIVDFSQTSQPRARPVREIIHNFYSNHLDKIRASIRASFQQEAQLREEIANIRSGSLDDRLLDLVPDQVRARIKTRANEIVSEDGDYDKETEVKRDGRGEKREAGPSAEEAESESVVRKTRAGSSSSRRRGSRTEDTIERHPTTEGQAEPTDEHVIKDEESEEDEAEAGDPESTLSSRKEGRSGRKRGTVEAGTREGTATPASDAEEDAEGDEEETGRKRPASGRGRSGRGGSVVAATSVKGKRGHKRKTSEPASPGPGGSAEAGSSEIRPSKRVKSESEVAADGARFRKAITLLLSQLDDDPAASMFKTAVRKTDAPSYQDAIKRPMWLGQVLQRVKKGLTKDHVELMRDVALLCANAVQFNGRDDEVGVKAQELWDRLESMVEEYLSREVEQ